VVHQVATETGVIKGFEDQVGIHLGRGFVRDHYDAAGAGFLQNGLQRLHRKGHHADGIDLLGDQALDNLDLLCRVGLGGPQQKGVVTRLFSKLANTLAHFFEPGNSIHLDDRGDHEAIEILACLLPTAHKCANHERASQAGKDAQAQRRLPSYCLEHDFCGPQ